MELNRNTVFVIALLVAILIVMFIYLVKKHYRLNQRSNERFKQLIDKQP